MPQNIEARSQTIGTLLGRYERRPVFLPPFQRSYSWEKAQVSAFLDDLLAFISSYEKSPKTASYFFGPIVVMESNDQITLLDGQQRLATSIIALAAMRDIARSIDTPVITRGADFARDVQREILEKDLEPTTYSLTLGELDEPFFAQVIKTDPPQKASAKLRSHKLIDATYQMSRTKVSESLKGLSVDDSIKRLRLFYSALTKGFTVAAITVASEGDAFKIFETLNDRGLRLSVPDLVLNLLMSQAPDATARALVRQRWNGMLTQMGRRDVSRFLRHMWVSMYGDLKAEGLYAAIKDFLAQSKLTSVQFAEQCADECEAYAALLDIGISLPKEGELDLEGLVRYLNVGNSFPLLLAGYRCLNVNDFTRLLQSVAAIYVRHGLVANLNPLDLESTFYEAARTVRAQWKANQPSAKLFQVAKQILRKVAVSDKAVEEAAKDLFLERGEALWLLTRIANSMQSSTKEVGMHQASLEHIFPQNAGSAWPNRAQLEAYIWHIGNLTILGERLNSKAQNKSFSEKRTQYYAKSEIVMTKELLKLSKWDEATIQDRANLLAKRISELWRPL